MSQHNAYGIDKLDCCTGHLFVYVYCGCAKPQFTQLLSVCYVTVKKSGVECAWVLDTPIHALLVNVITTVISVNFCCLQ